MKAKTTPIMGDPGYEWVAQFRRHEYSWHPDSEVSTWARVDKRRAKAAQGDESKWTMLRNNEVPDEVIAAFTAWQLLDSPPFGDV